MSAELVYLPQNLPVQPAGGFHGGQGSYGPMPNEAIIQIYVQSMRAARLSENHITHVRQNLCRLADHLSPTLLVEARYPQLLAWQVSMSHLAAGTAAVCISNVRVFYRWLVRPMRILDVSPAEELIVPKVPARRPRPVPENHLQIAVACTLDPMMRAWLYLGAYAGLRCCEIAELQRGWVIDGEVPRLQVIGKGSKERVVYIGPQILSILEPFMERTGHLFLRANGRPFRAQNVSNRIGDHFKSVGLPYTAHQLRHRYGTRALALTKNIRVVQEQMGHSSPATTQVYAMVNEEETVDLAKALDAEVRDTRRT